MFLTISLRSKRVKIKKRQIQYANLTDTFKLDNCFVISAYFIVEPPPPLPHQRASEALRLTFGHVEHPLVEVRPDGGAPQSSLPHELRLHQRPLLTQVRLHVRVILQQQ